MTKRSLQASNEGIRTAKQAFKRKGWTQEYLATEVGLETRQPIWKFFTGKPIERYVFNEICFILELDPEDIAQKPEAEVKPLETIPENTLDINALVQKLRAAHFEKIQDQCNTLHLLDIARSFKLDDIYIDVNILEEITSQRWLEIADLQRFELNGNCYKVRQELVAGLEAIIKYSKLMVLGKPGSGKTTFLQSIAICCSRGDFKPDCLPIFISLKNFAEDTSTSAQISLLNYIEQGFLTSGVSKRELTTIFSHGKAVILLDGLDEVSVKNSDQIIQEIRYFSEEFYKSQIIINCRQGAQRYKFKGFTEVEISDFTKLQITAFANKWFLAIAKKSPQFGKAKAANFIQKLELPENRQIRELVTTPILLNLTCLVFQFIGDFPKQRSELYKQGLDLLLVRWDEARGIKRDEVYCNLSLLHKIKLLSRVAAITFALGDYFFPENKIQQIIADYIRLLPHAPNDADALQLDSISVLKSIEAQHGLLLERARGIYSFSHLTFQEYFTAREIVANAKFQTLQEFVTHIGEKRWQEVFLMAAGMLQPANDLLQLMKQQIDRLAISNKKFQNFLTWLWQKTRVVNASYHPASVRAFYFTLALPSDHPLAGNQNLALSLDCRLAGKLTVDLALDLALTHALAVSLATSADIFFQRLSAFSLALDLEHLLENNPSLQKSLSNVKNQLPSPTLGREAVKAWWQTYRETWIGELRSLMIGDREIGHDWQFTQNEWPLLQQYWDANKLLLDCLNTAGNVTPELRLIEETLFLVSG